MNFPHTPDPTDWDTTALPLLNPLDAALRCQICKDFFTAPVITHCQHTFCSECIRRALQAAGARKECPVCRQEEQEYRLRRNQVVEEMVEAFVRAREGVLRLAQAAQGGAVREGARENVGGEGEGEGEGEEMVEMVEGGRRKRRRVVMVEEEGVGEGVGEGCDVGVVPPSTIKDGSIINCPACQRRIKHVLINAHLDACLPKPRRTPSPPHQSTTPAPLPKIGFEITPAPLPKINFATTKDTALRQKLSSLGVPSHGPRKLLQERYTEWLTLWNANLDAGTAGRRRTKKELLVELAARERANSAPRHSVKDVDGRMWGQEKREEYDVLVERALRSRRKRVDGQGGTSDRDRELVSAQGQMVQMVVSPPPPGSGVGEDDDLLDAPYSSDIENALPPSPPLHNDASSLVVETVL